ncbi:hypothetical protein Godav_024924, partial [Gossypium davidsonii]|nr:hypothetical protein [Gossypium davidsonii]
SISLITKLLGRIYYFDALSKKLGTLPPHIVAAANGVAFCGTLAGQLFFGWLGDKLGQKRVYGLTLMLMVIFSISSGLSFGRSPDGVMETLCFFRFWLGFHMLQSLQFILLHKFINNHLILSLKLDLI